MNNSTPNQLEQKQVIQKLDDSVRWWFGRRKPINEFEHLKSEVYEKLELFRSENRITVTRDSGWGDDKNNYARYNIFIEGKSYVFPEHLRKIKGYDIWCISSHPNGIELSCHSDRHSRERLS